MLHDNDCTTNDGPDPYSKCKFPFRYKGSNVVNCQFGQPSPSADNKFCKRLSQQIAKRYGTFPRKGYSRVCIIETLCTLMQDI